MRPPLSEWMSGSPTMIIDIRKPDGRILGRIPLEFHVRATLQSRCVRDLAFKLGVASSKELLVYTGFSTCVAFPHALGRLRKDLMLNRRTLVGFFFGSRWTARKPIVPSQLLRCSRTLSLPGLVSSSSAYCFAFNFLGMMGPFTECQISNIEHQGPHLSRALTPIERA